VPNDDHEPRLASLLRPLLPYVGAALAMAFLWTGWVLLTRYDQNRTAERETSRREAQFDRELLDKLGGDKLTILAFYVSPAAIHRGTHVSLCYGVSNAASVVIEPGLGPWKPALSRCIDLQPRRTTAYTLTAKDAKGQTLTANTTLTVK
jgi:hypothetical protein